MGKATALVTGASGGIGLEFARRLAIEGYDVMLVSRSTEKLNAIADDLSSRYGVRASVFTSDLSEAGAARALYSAVRDAGHSIDVLINNAGFATYGEFASLDPDREAAMVGLNVNSLVQLTRLFVPEMISRRSGRIVNVASVAAFQAGPLMATYYASKAYVLSFSVAIANELRASGVTVTALCPGPTESGFQEVAQMAQSKLLKSGVMSAKSVVDAGYRGMIRGKTIVIPGLRNKIFVQATRLMPRRVAAALARRMQEAG